MLPDSSLPSSCFPRSGCNSLVALCQKDHHGKSALQFATSREVVTLLEEALEAQVCLRGLACACMRVRCAAQQAAQQLALKARCVLYKQVPFPPAAAPYPAEACC